MTHTMATDSASYLTQTMFADPEIARSCGEGNLGIKSILDSRRARLFIISGPSGVGKDSVIEQLRVSHSAARYVITATSRERRENEVDGKHYWFLEKEDFERRIAGGEFIEHERVYDNLYGVPRLPIVEGLAHGQDVIVKVDVKGASTLRARIDNTISIFLMPESMESLLRRLIDRKTEAESVIRKRFLTACAEIRRAGEFDYIVFNEEGQLDQAIARIIAIIDTSNSACQQPPVVINESSQ